VRVVDGGVGYTPMGIFDVWIIRGSESLSTLGGITPPCHLSVGNGHAVQEAFGDVLTFVHVCCTYILTLCIALFKW
jgi:hypothetical protein